MLELILFSQTMFWAKLQRNGNPKSLHFEASNLQKVDAIVSVVLRKSNKMLTNKQINAIDINVSISNNCNGNEHQS